MIVMICLLLSQLKVLGQTSCDSVSLFPYQEGFESFSAPSTLNTPIQSCWYRGSNDPLAAYPFVTTNYASQGSHAITFYGNIVSQKYSYLALPIMGVPLDSLTLSFEMMGTNPVQYAYQAIIGTMISPDSFGSFVPLDTIYFDGEPNTWVTYEVPLTYCADAGVHLAIANVGPGAWYLDNLVLDYTPNCSRPIGLNESGITAVSASLSWTGNSSQYEVQYQELSAAHWTTIMVNADTLMLTNLDPNTDYRYLVRGICSADDTSSWSVEGFFQTNCNPIAVSDSMPVYVDFEDENSPAPCWRQYYDNSDHSINPMTHSQTYALDGVRSFRFSSHAFGSPYGQYLVSPELESGDALELTFAYRSAQSAIGETFRVGYSEGGSDASTSDFVWGPIIADADASHWRIYSGFFPATTKFVAIRYTSQFASYLYIDSLVIQAHHCGIPELGTPEVTANAALLTWSGSGIAYELSYRDAEAAEWTDVECVLDTTLYVSELMAATNYVFRVRTNCGNAVGYSDWVSGSFTTAVCGAVSNLRISNVTGHSVELSWTPGENNSRRWIVVCQAGDETPDLEWESQDTMITLTGLESGTAYTLRVYGVCGSSENLSNESESVYFSTVGIPLAEDDEVSILIFPNPATDRVTLRLPESYSEAVFGVIDKLGRKIMDGKIQGEQQIQVNSWPRGTYMVRIQLGTAIVIKKLIVV